MKKIAAIFLILLYFGICSAYAVHMPKVSSDKQLEMREHIYNSSDSGKILQSAVMTLQDSDFIIEEYEPELGFIRASKTFKANYKSKKRIAGWSTVLMLAAAYTAFSYGASAYSMYEPTRRVANEMRDKTVEVNVNVLVQQTSDGQTSVKFIPVAKVLQNADGFSFMQNAPIRVIRLYKPKVYDEFFNQITQNMN